MEQYGNEEITIAISNWGFRVTPWLPGCQCVQVRIQIQVQARHLIVRVASTTRTTDDGFQDSWDHVTDCVTDVKIRFKFLDL